MFLPPGDLDLVPVHLLAGGSGQTHSPNLLPGLLQLSHETCTPVSQGIQKAI